jgi:outer membrane protein insertion porin family
LFETGLFADVRMAQRTSVLIITVVENPIIDKVVFEGNKKYKDDQLGGALQSQARGIYTQSVVQSDTQRLLEFYRRSGRFQASVEPQIINLNANRVILVFVVKEGPETLVARINFIGNQRYSDGKLRDLIATRQTGPLGILNWFRSTDTYDPDRLAADEEKIRRFYLEHGYADIQIISTVADLDIERNIFFVTITIDEGQRYKFGTIEVDSAIPGVDSEYLRRKVTAREGAWYSSRRVEESLEEITIELAGTGYAFAQVRPRIDRDSVEGIIHITMVVDEGTRAYIERIEIRGNTRTRDYVIRREFELAEGDAYNRVLIDQAERRLRGLGFFREIRITIERGTAPDRVFVIVSVEEQPTGEFSFGAGYSTNDGIVGDISVTERNFLGRGYAVRLAVGGGDSSRTYEFGWTDPMFLGRPISAGFNIYRKDYDENDYRSYSNLSTGGGFNLGFPITQNVTFTVGYNIEQQEIDVAGWVPPVLLGNPCPVGVSNSICASAGEYLISSGSYSLIYDSIDDKRNPREGIFARFSQTVAGVGGDG